MFWNTIPCSVANYFTTKIYQKCHFSAFYNLFVRNLSQNSRSFDVQKSTSLYSIHHLSFREILMRICLPFCLGFDVLNLFSSIKTVSSWFPIGGVSTLSDMMMTCFESSALAPLCYSNFLSDGEIFRMENMQEARKFLLIFINESTPCRMI